MAKANSTLRNAYTESKLRVRKERKEKNDLDYIKPFKHSKNLKRTSMESEEYLKEMKLYI